MIDPHIILVNIDASSKTEILELLSETVYAHRYIDSTSNFIQAVLERENEISTSVGNLIAIPHGKTSSVCTPFVAFAKVNHPFKWDDTDKLVQLIFLIGVPEKDAGMLHLKILSQLSRRLIHPEFVNRLLTSKTTDEVYEQLLEIEQSVRGEEG